MTVASIDTFPKEEIKFKISSKHCCLLSWTNSSFCNIPELIGGYFGAIPSGRKKVVTLVWPTTVLHNLIGVCDIILDGIRPSKDKVEVKDHVRFNTTLGGNLMHGNIKRIFHIKFHLTQKQKTLLFLSDFIQFNITKCKFEDQDMLKGCASVSCEQKYFGRKNFYNHRTHRCESTACCTKNKVIVVLEIYFKIFRILISILILKIYDYLTNKCVVFEPENLLHSIEDVPIVTNHDIDLIRKGHFRIGTRDLNLKERKQKKRENIRLNIMKVISVFFSASQINLEKMHN